MSGNKSKESLVDTIGNFTVIPNTVIELIPKMGASAFTVFSYLRFRSGAYNDKSWPSYETMVDELGLSRQTIANSLGRLEELGLLERKRNYNKATDYYLKMPAVKKADDQKSVVQKIDYKESSSLETRQVAVYKLDTNKNQLTRTTDQEQESLERALPAQALPQAAKPQAERQPRVEDKYIERAANAMREGHIAHYGITEALGSELRVIPNERAKNWKRTFEFLKAQPDPINGIKLFGKYWYNKDWRGKQGQAPSADLIVELWLVATKPAPEEQFREVYG